MGKMYLLRSPESWQPISILGLLETHSSGHLSVRAKGIAHRTSHLRTSVGPGEADGPVHVAVRVEGGLQHPVHASVADRGEHIADGGDAPARRFIGELD